MRIPVSFVVIAFILAEIAGLVLVGRAIGVLATLGLVVLGMLAGSMLLRRSGLATLANVQAELAAGTPPARQLAEGAVLALAALLIILPGFLSDLIGAALFVPAVRGRLWRAIGGRLQVRAARSGGRPRAAPRVVDLDRSEYATPPAADPRPGPDSPWRRQTGGGP